MPDALALVAVLHREEAVLLQLLLVDLVDLQDPFHGCCPATKIFKFRLEKISASSAWVGCFAWSAARLPMLEKCAGKPSRK